MQQTIYTAQIDESAVLGEVLYHSGKHGSFFQVLQGLGLLFVLFLFHQLLARDDDVSALLVQLDHGDFNNLALEDIQITQRTQISLGSRQERLSAEDVDRQS